jgi:hypothetical protein
MCVVSEHLLDYSLNDIKYGLSQRGELGTLWPGYAFPLPSLATRPDAGQSVPPQTQSTHPSTTISAGQHRLQGTCCVCYVRAYSSLGVLSRAAPLHRPHVPMCDACVAARLVLPAFAHASETRWSKSQCPGGACGDAVCPGEVSWPKARPGMVTWRRYLLMTTEGWTASPVIRDAPVHEDKYFLSFRLKRCPRLGHNQSLP